MTGLLDGKVAVITGAGSGMAKASVHTFVREGARVVAADISGAEKDVAAELGAAVLPVHCDVTHEDDVEAAMRAAVVRVRPARRSVQRRRHRRCGADRRRHHGALRQGDGHRSPRRAPRHEARDPHDARVRQRRLDRQLVVDRRLERVAHDRHLLRGEGGRDLRHEDRGHRVRAQGHPGQLRVPRLHQDRGHGRGARQLSRCGRRHAHAAPRPAPRDRGGRGLPVLGAGIVRHRAR